MPINDPDDLLVVLFKHLATENKPKSLQEGRPIYDDVEICEIRAPGSKDVKVFPATAFARWIDDPLTGEQTKQSYAERFSHQYRQFKAKASQTKQGTPLDFAPFLTEGRRSELKAQNIYTVEQLSAVEGAELKNLGPGGREMKNAAEAFIGESKMAAPNLRLAEELAALKARNAVLEEDNKIKQERRAAEGAADSEFDAMSLDELRAYIEANTGKAPMGSLNRKNLTRMAENSRPEKAA